MAKNKKSRPKVGFYGLTGCAGCLLSVIFNEDELLDIISNIDIVAFPFIKGENDDTCPLDICFIEGTIVSNDDLEIAKKLRERSKTVIALGTCACEGNIPSIRNFHDKKDFDKLLYKKNHQIQDLGNPVPLHKMIEVDISIPGCPPDRDEIKTFIKHLLLGKIYYGCSSPVCEECKLAETNCLLDDKIICAGPITKGGCKAVCTTHGLRCYGCRGLTDDANFDEYFTMLKEKGFTEQDIKKILDTFSALEVDKRLEGTRWQRSH